MREPVVGPLAQAMVHVQCDDLEALLDRNGQRRVQQSTRVAPAAVGHGDAACSQRVSPSDVAGPGRPGPAPPTLLALFGVAEAAVGLQPLVAPLQQGFDLEVADLTQ